MNSKLARFPYQISALSGLVAGGVYSFGLPSILLPLFILPYLLIFIRSPKRLNLKKSLKISSAFFLVFFLTVLVWFLDTDVTLLAGLDNTHASILLGFCLLTMSLVLTLACLPFGFVMYKLQNRLRTPSFVTLLVASSAWVVVEWFRSLVFAIFLYAPGASIGDYWNFGSLGLGLTDSPVGYLNRIVGMYGLSMLVITCSICISWALNKAYRPLLIVLSFAIFGSFAGYKIVPKSSNPPISGSVLQRQGSLSDLEDSYAAIKNKTDSPKDLIVLNEYSEVYQPANEAFAKKYVENRLSKQGVSINVDADFSSTAEPYGTLLVRDKTGNLIGAQTKQLLIPTGEYLPGILQIFYKYTGQNKINSSFGETRKLRRGEPPRVINSPKVTIAPVACSGILGRNIYRQLVNDGGEVLTNSASLLIFGGSRAYFRQSLQMARFHAIANNRTYIQASMGASAFVIDNDGKFIVAPEDKRTSFIDFNFVPVSDKTPYTRFGEWPLLISGVVMAAYLGLKIKKKLINRRKH